MLQVVLVKLRFREGASLGKNLYDVFLFYGF